MSLAAADLDALDALMTRAFATGDASRLDVLGYGEMTTVVAFASGGKRYACKRLPPFATAQDADRYAALFLDVTTPMLKDEAGRDRLDTELFLAAVPPPVRPLFRRYVVHQVIDKYHDPRGVALDLIANLIKEGQEHRIAPFLQAANRRLAQPLDSATPADGWPLKCRRPRVEQGRGGRLRCPTRRRRCPAIDPQFERRRTVGFTNAAFSPGAQYSGAVGSTGHSLMTGRRVREAA